MDESQVDRGARNSDDGQPASANLTVKVDGQPCRPGSRLRFGKKSLVIESAETEPVSKNCLDVVSRN